LKEEALDRTMWRNRFGRGFGPVVWQITDDDDEWNCGGRRGSWILHQILLPSQHRCPICRVMISMLYTLN